jgi:hypothetical protein
MCRWIITTSFTFKNIVVALRTHLMKVVSTRGDCHPLSTRGEYSLKFVQGVRCKDAEHCVARFIEYGKAERGPDDKLRIR